MNQQELFKFLNASSDEDILRHFPTRYESLIPTPLPKEYVDGQRYVVKGKVTYLKPIGSIKSSIIRFRLLVGNTTLSCMIYNQPFYLNKLSANKEACCVLYYSENRNVFMLHSAYDLDSYYVITGLKPVYNLPKGVNLSYFSNYLKKILSFPKQASYMLSPLPSKYIEKYRLLNEFDSFRCVHLPRNEKDLNQGLRVFKYEEALSYCVKALSLKKEAQNKKKNSVSSISHEMVNRFVSKLSYKLTKDQLIAIKDIVEDMEKETIMYRLLQGDVGTGKTIVSFVSLYANYLRGKQGVLMAPTFELATQHYNNAKKVFMMYPDIKISFVAGNNLTSKTKNDLQQKLKDGSIDILISTHAVLSEKMEFNNLGLAIIDEQQLFGVQQREELLEKGESVDLLMMSATPIPRTLCQIINADLDVSTLSMFPHGQRNVETRVVQRQDPIINTAIEKALASNRQVFIVAPKITDGTSKASSAEEVYNEINSFFPGKCQLLHGKIKKEDRDGIITRFTNNEKPILVSTTVIQVGIDVSSACLLIIYDANYFGLSTLHQLRGRIGRSGEYALALLIYNGMDLDAKEKLDFLAKSQDGFAISEFDLKQRGSGSYSGVNQSGKSELNVCNFVDDSNIFAQARIDATEILNNSSEADNAKYLKTLSLDKKLNLS